MGVLKYSELENCAVLYIFMPILLRFWVLANRKSRRKTQLEQDYNQRMQAPPISLQQAMALSDRAYVRVTLEGQFDI